MVPLCTELYLQVKYLLVRKYDAHPIPHVEQVRQEAIIQEICLYRMKVKYVNAIILSLVPPIDVAMNLEVSSQYHNVNQGRIAQENRYVVQPYAQARTWSLTHGYPHIYDYLLRFNVKAKFSPNVLRRFNYLDKMYYLKTKYFQKAK